jgi:hypothetical protein
MSKPETNPNVENRIKIGNAEGISCAPAGHRPKPRRGFLFIDGGGFPKPAFCFSAARISKTGCNHNSYSDGSGARKFVGPRAAEKQKVKKEEAGASYKQGTPTGLGPKRGRAHLGIGSFEFLPS